MLQNIDLDSIIISEHMQLVDKKNIVLTILSVALCVKSDATIVNFQVKFSVELRGMHMSVHLQFL